MRLFARVVFAPAMLVLFAAAALDCRYADGQLGRNVGIGLLCGLAAAVSYDVFRLPFVFARPLGIAALVPPMNLFKVFPGFGAMILGLPVEQASYSTTAQLLGWAYHFSNGATFGVMYLALVGDATRRHWAWAIVMAAGLELGMLFTPYPRVFGITVTPRFVVVTLMAHAIFGVCLGLAVRCLAGRWRGARAEV